MKIERREKEVRSQWVCRRREKIIPKFLYIPGRRQTENYNKCQSSKSAKNHFKKKISASLKTYLLSVQLRKKCDEN